MIGRNLPPANTLTRAQYSGWACCWCGRSLLHCGGVSEGIARGRSGVHILDVEVYACPSCASPARELNDQTHKPVHESGGRP